MAEAPKIRVELSELSNEIPKEIEMPDLNEEVAQQGYVKIKIHHFSALRDIKKHYLDPIDLCGKQWRILLFPMGNQCESLSLYVDYFGPKEGKWATCAQFGITVYGEAENHFREAHHRFTEEEIDWGFTQFIPKKTFYSEEKGKRYLVDDTITIGFSLKIMKDPIGTLWHNFLNYDSKAETGCNGLKNQGATCYMNSILQSLFFTNYLRRAVFRMPTDEDDPAKSIPLALQRVFYHLQYSDKPVGTTELTKSFGWDAVDSFMQHDVQEFNRVLCDKLETKMKGTPVEGTINYLLEGKMKSYVKCTNIDFESSREESFYDIQLNVKGLKNLKQSFDDYIQVETLDGDNKYEAEGHGLQEAKKGVIFKKLPPVLHLQLKRFEYDMMKDAMVKINDRHEFPESIDLGEYLEESERKEPQIYILHGVLVHSGDLHGGHYCAFIRPEKNGQWLKFDDDRVVKCHPREAMDENFGVDPEDKSKETYSKPVSRFSKKFTNAYMLVYIRESEIDKVLCPVEETDLSEPVRARFILEQQMEEQKRKEKEEQHLYMQARVVTQQIASNYHLTDLCSFETKTESAASALTLKFKKDLLLKDFKVMLAEHTKVPPERQRLWVMAKRQNGTIRPDENLEKFENEQMGTLRERLKLTVELRIFVEESTVQGDQGPFFPPYNLDNDILLFVKYYDPKKSLLQFEAPYLIKSTDRPVDLIAKINARAGRPANHPLKLYEEVRPTMVEKIKSKETFQRLEIGTGDIVCYCEDVPADQLKDLELPTPLAYYEHILNSVQVHFRERNNPKDTSQHFTLLMSKKMTYEAVADKVSKHLGVDPLYLRFVSHNHYTEGPKQEFKYEPQKLLEGMLQPNTYQPISEILYYEKLEIPITELENKKPVSVSWVTSKMTEEGPYKLLVNKNDNVEQLLELLKTKIKTAAPDNNTPVGTPSESPKDADVEMKDSNDAEMKPVQGAGQLRLVEVFNNRISKVFSKDEPVKNLNDYSTFYAEEIPADQLHVDPRDQLVNGFHFHKDPYSSHGIPFVFLLKAGEEWKDTVKRIRQRLATPEKEFEKYKFALVSFGRSKYITEDNIVLADTKFGSNDYLGVDHVDKAPRPTGRGERAIVFRN